MRTHLVFRLDVGAAMDPTVVLSHVGTDPLELTAGENIFVISVQFVGVDCVTVLQCDCVGDRNNNNLSHSQASG